MIQNILITLRRIFDRYFRYGYNLGIQGYTRSNVSFAKFGWQNYNKAEDGWRYGFAEFKRRTGKESRWDDD